MMNDRGSIKWTAMMLPEHVELLRRRKRESQKVRKPILDSQQLEYIEQQLQEAIANTASINATYYEDGDIQSVVGQLTNVNVSDQQIHVTTENGVLAISFSNIINIQSD